MTMLSSIASKFIVVLAVVSLSDSSPSLGVDEALSRAPLGRTGEKVAFESWGLMKTKANEAIRSHIYQLEENYRRFKSSANISLACDSNILTLFANGKEAKTWAVSILDSWGKLPSGLLEGTFTNMGSYDECLGVVSTNSHFSPQYCTLHLRPLIPTRPKYHNILHPIPILHNFSVDTGNVISRLSSKAQFFYYTSLRIGICLPSSCSLQEIDRLANNFGKELGIQGRATRCESKEALEPAVTPHQVISLLVVFLLLIMTVVGTSLDLLSAKSNEMGTEESFIKNCFIAFSFHRNAASLLRTKSPNKELKCLNGMRCVTMAWIIMGHTAVWIHHEAFARSYGINDMLTSFYAQAFYNATLSVDTFYFISGLITVYVTWSTTSGDPKNFSSFWFIISRYLRLTPGLIFGIIFILFLPYMGSGPLWHEVIDPVVNGCNDNWWVNLLYLQNYVNSEQMCLMPSWWLANDMHFHILSLVVVLALMRRPVVAYALNLVIILSFTVAAGLLVYSKGYPPTVLTTVPQIEEVWKDYILQFFFKPYVHAGPFFIGVFLGYALVKKQFAKLSSVHLYFGWTIAVLTLFAALKGPFLWNLGAPYSALSAAVFSATNRNCWAIALCWVVYACASGRGGWINSFLSWKAFVPLARLTYMVYLTHMCLIWIFMGTRRQLLDATSYTGIYMFTSHLVLAYVLGFFFTIFFETPFLVLQKQMYKKYKPIAVSPEVNYQDCLAAGDFDANGHPIKLTSV